MDPLRKIICGNLSGDWSGSWNYDIPLIPVCETVVTLPVLLLVYGCLICVPYTLRLGFRKNTHKRSLSGLLISEIIVLVIIISNGIGRTCIQLFHYVDDDWRLFVFPLSIICISLVQSIIWHFERIRNAANSSVCFFLNLFSVIVIFARCWNHLTDFWIQQFQTTTFNATSSDAVLSSVPPGSTMVTHAPATIQIIDLVTLGMCLVLFILGCFSERMLIYQASIKKKGSFGGLTPDCFPKKFPKIGAALPSELGAALPEKPGQNKFVHQDEQKPLQNPSPENHVSFPSRAVYAWFADLIYRGYRKPLEMSDLWSLDDVHRAHNVSKQFSKHLDLHVVPKQSVNYYQERRRISLLNSTAENANCVYQHDDLIADRRRSTQSILGVGVPVSDRSHTYRSGCVETVMQEDRRASDGCTSRPVNLNQRSGAAAQSTPCNMTSSMKSPRARLPTQKEESGSGSLKKRESVSTPDSVADSVRVSRGEDAIPTNADLNQVQSAYVATPPSVDFAGVSSHNSSVRRSVRIRAGTKLDILPRQSESRSNLSVKLPDEEMTLKGRDGGSEKLNTSLQTKMLMNSNVLSDASKAKAHGTQETAGSKLRQSDGVHKDKQGKWGFIVALIEMFWTRLVWTGLLKLLHDTLLFISPLLLKVLLKFMQGDHGEPVWHGYLYAVAMFVAACTQTLILQRYFRDVNIMGMHLRTVITCAVYRKSLRLSNKARCESTTGQIMNLISSDAQHFTTLMPYMHVVWSGPFQIVVAIVLLWRELGPSVLAGIGVLLLLLPFNAVIARLSKTVQEKKFMAADSRVKMITEILNGIRVIKLYAWEPSFITEVNRLRQKEVHYLRRFAYLQSVSFLWTCAPFLVALSTFGVFVMVSDQNILDAQKAFVSLTLFNILRFPLFMFPMVTSSLIQAYVSGMRLNHFLQLIELNPDSVFHEDTPGVAAVIERGVFGWDSGEEPVLHNISIQFPEGQLTSVMGSVGSGKSSLLHALLGDMERLNGCVNIKIGTCFLRFV
ncbi:hypothetical protein EG68_07260 [Paragonimus skrjabini miyazakii]|uniref:ABC transmembrane type-1 domain-containing protein n=1 Tax=Paragonimus skrjabini miyazakii TaxID=59628 RepID=A0A8S9YVJ1_9TREM|nr:hypothetical protein EG68_07260 [Paragonimus skrjabini miyazakii]